MNTRWNPSRDAALECLSRFAGSAGSDYTRGRNFVAEPGKQQSVSQLSPYIRRRMVTEQEVINAVLQKHTPAAADKFIQEVLWRTYWQGWLAQRPAVWRDYCRDRQDETTKLDHAPDLRSRYEQAMHGRTGIECFDAWVTELVEQGYLHNHARMWFASIWIFTLELPWVLGADFFYRHLLDADPASNTLSWRWVGGLHTKGKHYAARADNICTFTHGRFNPAGQLNESPSPLHDPRVYACEPLPVIPKPEANKPSLLLLTEDDVLGDLFCPAGCRPTAIAFLDPGRALPRQTFSDRSLKEAVHRLAEAFDAKPVDRGLTTDDVLTIAQDSGAEQILMMQPAVGETRDRAAKLMERLRERGMKPALITRQWDQVLFPYATTGFFRFKKQIPRLLTKLMKEDDEICQEK